MIEWPHKIIFLDRILFFLTILYYSLYFEENYRSTQNILNVASELIKKNENRLGKELISNQNQGELVNLNCFKNGKDEAIKINKYRRFI